MLEAGPAFYVLQPLFERGLGRFLEVAVDRRVHPKATLVHALPAETLDQLATHLLLEIEAEGFLDLERVDDLDRRRFRSLRRCGVDRPRVDHRQEDDVPARDRAIEVDVRRVARRRLDEAREQRRLVDLELGGRLPEIAAGSRLDAVQAVAEVHLVEIHLENLLLRVQVLEVRGHDHFPELATVSLAAVQEHQPRQLLRDGTAALGAAARLQVLQERTADPDGIDAAVIEEPLILDRDDGLEEVLGHLLERNFDPLLFEDRESRPVARVENGRRLDHVAHVSQRLAVGKAARQVIREPGHPPGREQHGDREDADRRGECLWPPRERPTSEGRRTLLEPAERVLERKQKAMHDGLTDRKRRAGSACHRRRANYLIICRLRPGGQRLVWLRAQGC